MSTISHILYKEHIEIYHETSEPQSIFGKWIGYNVYIIIEPPLFLSMEIRGQFLTIKVMTNEHTPNEFVIWGDSVISADVDMDGLLVVLEGGHFITEQIEKLKFTEPKKDK